MQEARITDNVVHLRPEVGADAHEGAQRGCVRLYDALLELYESSGPLNMGVTDDELIAILTRGDQAAAGRSITRWKAQLRETQPPAIYTKVQNNRTFYRLRLTHDGLMKVIEVGDPGGESDGDRGDPLGYPVATHGPANARERSSSSSSPASPASPGLATGQPRVANTRSATASPLVPHEDLLDGGLLQWAGIDDIPMATYKLSLLPDFTAKRALMDVTVQRATKSRPGYLCECVDTYLEAAHRGEYPPFDELASGVEEEHEPFGFARYAGVQASDGLSRGQGAVPTAVEDHSRGEIPRIVTGSTPVARSKFALRLATALVAAGRFLERWAR